MNSEQEKMVSVISETDVLLKLCLHVTLFYREDEQRSKRQAFLEILKEHTQLTGNRYRWTVNPKTEAWKPLKKGVNSYIHPQEWLPDAPPNAGWYLVYHGGQLSSDASDVEVYADIRPPHAVSCGCVQAQFPIDQFDGETSGLPELAQKWCALLKPENGYGGFRWAESHRYSAGRGAVQIRLLSQRFLGVDIGETLWKGKDFSKGIQGADWLTMLSDAYIEKLGGIEAIRRGMGSLPMLSYPGGVILQAGIAPLLGDVQRNDEDMAPYRQVARIVEPIRAKGDFGGYSGTSHGFTKELYQKWLARFSPQPE